MTASPPHSVPRPFGSLTRFAALALLSISLNANASSPMSSHPSAPIDPKAQVVALLASIQTGDPKAASVIDPHTYIQHNLAVGDGLAGFAAALQALPKGSAKVRTVRVFRDGDMVFAHTDYDFFGPKIGFDVFRFKDGKIVEHWDNLQATPATPNPSGRTMIDGTTTAKDPDKTAANKALVAAFVDDILVHDRLERLDGYFAGDRYLQHNPHIGDGASSLRRARAAMAQSETAHRYRTVHKILGEGDFVLAMSEGDIAGKPVAFYDLFRVENGKIAEHWDTLEAIPPRAEWKNANGKF